MSAIDQLITYIKSLTPEQISKVEKNLPFLIAEPANKREEYIFAIIKELLQTKDISLLDLIYQLLQQSRKA